jgi:hypothetical protein
LSKDRLSFVFGQGVFCKDKDKRQLSKDKDNCPKTMSLQQKDRPTGRCSDNVTAIHLPAIACCYISCCCCWRMEIHKANCSLAFNAVTVSFVISILQVVISVLISPIPCCCLEDRTSQRKKHTLSGTKRITRTMPRRYVL